MDYEFLKRYMKQHKITRAKLAMDIGIPLGTLNTMFTRKAKRVDFTLVKKLTEIYDIPLERLFPNINNFVTKPSQKSEEELYCLLSVKLSEIAELLQELSIIGKDRYGHV